MIDELLLWDNQGIDKYGSFYSHHIIDIYQVNEVAYQLNNV